jgi:hypothetical protein
MLARVLTPWLGPLPISVGRVLKFLPGHKHVVIAAHLAIVPLLIADFSHLAAPHTRGVHPIHALQLRAGLQVMMDV